MEERLSNHLDSLIREQLRARLAEWSARNFRDLERWKETENSVLYYFEFNQQKYVIKNFKRKELFDVELSAFVGLAHTNRICEKIFDSTELPNYQSQDFPGPYFLVKPYFDRVMHREHDFFRLLDRAAQQADISYQFLSKGWRDLDGDFKNDAIDPSGRVIRFDLDGAQPNWMQIRKFYPGYQGVQAQKDRKDIRDLYERLLSLDAELISLAIRLSRLFLDLPPTEWTLLTQIQTHGETGKSDGSSRQHGSRWHRIKSRLWDDEPTTSSLAKSNGLSGLREEWLKLWLSKIPSEPTTTLRGLNEAELTMLSILLFHLISQREPKFTDVKDLYFSLLLFLSAALHHRASAKSGESISQAVDQLTELKSFIPKHESPAPAPPKPAGRTSESNLLPSVSWIHDGKSWAATQKEGGRQCEDLVLELEGKGCPIYVLADGATRANGARAIEIVEEVAQSWAVKLIGASAEQTQWLFGDLAEEIHNRLLAEGYAGNSQCETTLLLAALCSNENPPAIVLGRWGNSKFLITYENESAIRQRVAILRERDSPSLGAWGRESPRMQPVKILKLNSVGKYHVRAFSDGVKEVVHPELLGDKGIVDLVRTAETWDKDYPTIGTDDWAIAGFDVSVSRPGNIVTVKSDAQSPPPTPQGDVLPDIKNVEWKRFELSGSARDFWRLELGANSQLYALSQYSVIKQVLGDIPQQIGGPEKEIHPHPSGTPAYSRMSIRRPVIIQNQLRADREQAGYFSKKWWREVGWIWSIAIVALVIFCLSIWYWRSEDQSNETKNSRESSVNSKVENTGVQTEPDFDSEQQRSLYNSLKANRSYVINKLPVGASINAPIFDAALKDLASVLRQTEWSVVVEVHTDKTGRGTEERRREVNLRTSEQRSNALEDKFIRNSPNLLPRVKFVGLGEFQPHVPLERTQDDRNLNRRIVIRRAS